MVPSKRFYACRRAVSGLLDPRTFKTTPMEKGFMFPYLGLFRIHGSWRTPMKKHLWSINYGSCTKVTVTSTISPKQPMSNFRAITWNVYDYGNYPRALLWPEISEPSAFNRWRSLKGVFPPLNMKKWQLSAYVWLWKKAFAFIKCNNKSSCCRLLSIP